MARPQKPRTAEFVTNDGMHAAMRIWARDTRKASLVCTVTYPDETVFTQVFDRVQVEVPYRTPDGELYTQTVDGTPFEALFLDPVQEAFTLADLKERMTAWLKLEKTGGAVQWRFEKPAKV